ncbi:hypothetical protein [Aeromicrobium sp. Leaf350]|uniref:hypothetical protein n=1 Tax=Aeromicrobium sp. Leaf350 TaxID=2876565 RepID=UPI001E2DF51A|nr:hypothetical protein [Aeromicrobium sp. Leaf350]
MLPHTPWTRVRTLVNWLNLSTLLGLAVARLGGARLERRGRGTWLAGGYRWDFPRAGAFTIGSVVISTRDLAALRSRPTLLRHEDRHCTQYAWCLGPVMLVPYLLGVAASWVVAGDHSSYNPFERLAGLREGGYPEPRTRRSRRRDR